MENNLTLTLHDDDMLIISQLLTLRKQYDRGGNVWSVSLSLKFQIDNNIINNTYISHRVNVYSGNMF